MKHVARVVLVLVFCLVLCFPDIVRGASTARMASMGGWTEHSLSGIDIMCLAVAPTYPVAVYAGSWAGGVFRSTNGGVSWTPANSGLTSLIVWSLVISPAAPTTLFAGTSDGVFRSSNGGTTWVPANTGLANENVLALAIDPATPSALYAGTWGDGVFRSTDDGATWVPVNYGSTDQWVSSIVVNPAVPAIVLAGTLNGIFRSTDGGSLWTPANTGLTGLDIRCLSATSTALYAGTSGSGVFRSIDSGTTWSQMNTGLTNLDVQCLAIDPRTLSALYAGTSGGGVFRSTDSGMTWSQMNTGLTNLDVQCLAIDPLTSATLYAGAFCGGVFQYDAPASFALATTTSPSSGGSVTKSPDAPSYVSGTVVTLTAGANSGYHFVSWSGATPDWLDPLKATVTMDTDKTVVATFTADMASPSLSLASPNGSESLVPGSVRNVTWAVTGDTSAIHHFSLYYTVDGGNSWERAGGGFAGSADRTFAWTVPARFSSRARVVVYAMNAASELLAYDASNAFFTIAPEGTGTLPGVSLAHPSAESWGAGTTQTITWSVTGSLPVSFHHFSVYASLEDGRNGSWFSVGFSPVNSLSWDVPATFGSAHTKIVVYAMDVTSHLLSDAFPASFAISPATGPCNLTVTAPAGGSTLHVGALTSVAWNMSGTLPPQVTSYRLYFSVDGGLSWEPAGTAPSSPFSWTIPVRLSSSCFVMVVALDASASVLGVATSPAFAIAP